jgi:uncharacterized protein YbcI
MNEASGEQLADVSNAIVRILSEGYGRGPTKAKSFAFDNYLFTVLEDVLTTVEQTLVESGEEELVRTVRLSFQESIARDIRGEVERILGRDVVGYHSQVAFHPPMAFEFFVLD